MKKSIHRIIGERIALAEIYAEDGAFHSAARVLDDLAKQVKAHATACDEWEDKETAALLSGEARP